MDEDRLKSLCHFLNSRFLLSASVFFILSGAAAASAAECVPFEIYRGISPPPMEPVAELASVDELMRKIASSPGHVHFSRLYREENRDRGRTSAQELSFLNCIHRHLKQDTDRDGSPDWAIASSSQIFSRLMPADEDWDNDGIANVFDASPFHRDKGKKRGAGIPPHLLLHRRADHPLNVLQRDIHDHCGVLALNHTDTHALHVLRAFDRICSGVLKKFKARPYTFILYAFAGHSLFNDIVASYYAEMNAISIGGRMIERKSWDEGKIRRTLLHEIGHYLIFRKLKPADLARAANLHGNWRIPENGLISFFDPLLLQPGLLRKGFFPSSYSATNAHEWFSEVVSLFFMNRLEPGGSEALPKDLEDWLTEKLQP